MSKNFAEKLDRIATDSWMAYPIFLAVLFVVFNATFTLGRYPMDWIEWLVARFSTIVAGLMQDGWFKDLIVDGIIAGAGSVLVFLPNILILYFFINLLEESGYMARASLMMDRVMHHIGLHGESFIPMIMGFGCNVPAIMATRSIRSRRRRLITICIIPFMSCTGKLPVFVLLAGAFFPGHEAAALMCIYLIGVVIAILSALFLQLFLKNDNNPSVMTLPPFHIPDGKIIWHHTWEEGRQYLQKIATTILVGSIIIWGLGYFPHNTELDRMHQQEQSYLGQVGKAVAPALDPLGFSWKMDIGLITGVVSKELVVSSLGVMYSDSGKDLKNALSDNLPLPSAIAFMVFVLLYFPCIATFAAIKNETGKWKWAIFVCVYTMVVAWLVAWLAYMITSIIC